MSLAVDDMYWRLNARRRVHRRRFLGFKSLRATTMDTLVLKKEIRKGKDVEFLFNAFDCVQIPFVILDVPH